MDNTAKDYSHRDFADFDDDAIRAGIGAAMPSGDGPLPLYRALAASPAYPVDALGPVLAPAAKAIAGQAQCSMAVAGGSVLSVASLAAQGRADAILPIGQGAPTPLSLFMLTVLKSGERKSTADRMALKPVRDVEVELKQAEEAERAAWVIKAASHETKSKALHHKLKDDRAALEAALHDLGPPPLPPLLPLIAPSSDPTYEGLFRIYQAGRPSLAMLCDDGATFLGGHSMKAENKAGTVANLCRAWDGSRLERIRAGDGVLVLYGRRLACHLMIQPDVAAGFLSDRQFADQGLIARFLVAAPDDVAVKDRIRSENAAEERAEAARAALALAPYNQAIEALLRAPIRWKNERDRTAGVDLDHLPLSDDARTLYIRFHNQVTRELATGQALESVKPFASKLAENSVRIAGILALVADDRSTEIDAATLADAMTLAKFHADEALRLTDAACIAPALKQAEQLLCWLHARPGHLIGLKDIYQTGPKVLRSAKAAREAMHVLAEHCWVIPLPDGAEIDGKRHREAWRVVQEVAP